MAKKRRKASSGVKTKVVVRRLPPDLTEEKIMALDEIQPFLPDIEWSSFIPASHRFVIDAFVPLGHLLMEFFIRQLVSSGSGVFSHVPQVCIGGGANQLQQGLSRKAVQT
jgi:hypothetical protein